MNSIVNFLALLGGAGISIIAITAASYAVFRWLGKKWIEDQFERSLEQFRHEKMRELEALRADLNTKLNRSAILNEREFEVLPETYRRLAEAHGEVARFTSPLQSNADVDRMNDAQIDELLEKEKFSSHEKSEVKSSIPKSKKYQDLLFWKQLNAANEPYREFNNYYITNSIFIDDELRKNFEALRSLMFDAMHEAQFEKQYPDPRPDRWKAREALRKEAKAKLDAVRDEVRGRLMELRTLADPEEKKI